MCFLNRLLTGILFVGTLPALSMASTSTQTWTPLISADMFTGIKTDVSTAVAGFLAIVLIIAGFGVLVKVFTR